MHGHFDYPWQWLLGRLPCLTLAIALLALLTVAGAAPPQPPRPLPPLLLWGTPELFLAAQASSKG